MDIEPVRDADIEAVVALWDRCGLLRPWNDPRRDIALARAAADAEVLVGRLGDAIVAAAMVGFDGHRGWIYYLAVEPGAQRSGHGRAMMAACEAWLRAGRPEDAAHGPHRQRGGARLLRGARLRRPEDGRHGQVASRLSR